MAKKKEIGGDFTPEKLTKYLFSAYPWWLCLILFFVIGGVFEALTRCNFMEYLLKKLVNKFYKKSQACFFVQNLNS